MKLLVVASFRITPNSGGVQRVTETLAKEFMRKGIQVYYLAFSKGNKETILGIDQYYLPEGKDFNSEVNKAFFKKFIKEKEITVIINQIGFSLPELSFIRKNIDTKTKVFTVHHNCVKCLNEQYHNIYLKTLKQKKISLLFNNALGWYFLKKIHKYRFGKIIEQTIRLTDKLVVLSDTFINELSFYTDGFEKSKIISIPNPNPYNNDEIDYSKKENIILYVGRLEYGQKRVDRLLKIWEHTFKEFKDWRLEIIGDGTMRNEMEEYVKNNKIERVTFHGFKDPHDFYASAKIFCLTSTFEGYGMVLVEAQSFGVVPISYRCFSSIDTIIDTNKTGYIIQEDDFKDYLLKLHTLMESDEKRYSMGIKGVEYVKKYNSTDIVKQWITYFNRSIDEI